MNFATELVGDDLDDYWEECLDLALAVVEEHGGDILFLTLNRRYSVGNLDREIGRGAWVYHAVALVDSYVHDAWLEGPALLMDEYLERAFPGGWDRLHVLPPEEWASWLSGNYQ